MQMKIASTMIQYIIYQDQGEEGPGRVSVAGSKSSPRCVPRVTGATAGEEDTAAVSRLGGAGIIVTGKFLVLRLPLRPPPNTDSSPGAGV